VAGSCEYGDEHAGSGATELVSINFISLHAVVHVLEPTVSSTLLLTVICTICVCAASSLTVFILKCVREAYYVSLLDAVDSLSYVVRRTVVN
jgi:hypothetical protein